MYVYKHTYTCCWSDCIWEFNYSLKFNRNPQINTCSISTVILRHMQRRENLSHPQMHVLSWNQTWCCFCLLSAFILQTHVLLVVYLMLYFLHFCVFWQWFCFLKWLPGIMWKRYLVFLSQRKLGCAYGECFYWISFVLAWVTVLLVMRLVLKNQQYASNKVSLKRNTHKTKLHIDQFMKVVWTGAHSNLILHFFWEQWFGML